MAKILASLFMILSLTCCEDVDPKNFPNLKIKTLRKGKGEETVSRWDTVKAHYVGRYETGEIFDSSYKRRKPKRFSMRSSTLIKGWKIGILGMKVGEKRRLIIPPELAFGKKGKFNSIPPNATLTFDIELMEIQ